MIHLASRQSLDYKLCLGLICSGRQQGLPVLQLRVEVIDRLCSSNGRRLVSLDVIRICNSQQHAPRRPSIGVEAHHALLNALEVLLPGHILAGAFEEALGALPGDVLGLECARAARRRPRDRLKRDFKVENLLRILEKVCNFCCCTRSFRSS